VRFCLHPQCGTALYPEAIFDGVAPQDKELHASYLFAHNQKLTWYLPHARGQKRGASVLSPAAVATPQPQQHPDEQGWPIAYAVGTTVPRTTVVVRNNTKVQDYRIHTVRTWKTSACLVCCATQTATSLSQII
jgi:hypothetical protein